MRTIPKLVECPDPRFAPNMVWNYVVVTERVQKNGKTDLSEIVCVTEEDVKEAIDNFLKYNVVNPAAVRGVHYNYAVFAKTDNAYTGTIPAEPVSMEEAVNKKMQDLSKSFLKIAEGQG
jgi:hypothetical protein